MERTPLTPLDPRQTPNAERLVRLRLMLLALSVCLWGVVVFIRLVQLQVLERGSYARQAARQSERTINLDSRRGAIVDRNGHDLALSVDAESIYAVPQEIEDPARAAAVLARALGLDTASRKELQVQLARNRAFVWVKRKVDPRHARAVRDLQLPGIGFLTENRRYYPKRELASQVLGYVGLDNTGMSGIEYEFEELIRGKAAKVTVHIDARRRPVGHTEKPSTDGHTIVLTLDETIQHAAERELERSMQETSSIAGVAVVMDPRTGEVLAMANRPTFNPNRFAAYGSARWRNRVVADAYEPGSIFKIFTAAAGLQEKRGRARRGHRLRAGLDRGGRHRHQRPPRVRPPDLPRRDREVERRGRRPRRAAARPRELQPLPDRLRLRCRDRRRPAGRVGGAAAAAAALERALAAVALVRPGGRRDRAADGVGRERRRERRLPDEAADRAAHRDERRLRW